ncbi:odorant receptor 30a-like [Choristoneura fumiferana]|uniref:odorant receptor 30a-like n=1 Tax=Choristoneura fumiferana TaxID=7141 RepID=UPI003D155E74
MPLAQSDSFKQNCFFWKVFGLWPGRTPNKYYKYFSFAYLMTTLAAYNALLTLNLYYTPRQIDLFIHEVIFYFTEIAISTKACMIIFKRKQIVSIFELLDCDEFKRNDSTGHQIVENHNSYYKLYYKIVFVVSHFTYLSQVLLPVIGMLIFKTSLDLPICEYYFLSEQYKDNYFTLIFVYQSVGMYGHMMYNVNIDTLIVGFMLLAIAQMKVLSHDLENLKIEKKYTGREEELDYKQLQKLHKRLKHYALVLKYCADFQEIINAIMFVQYGVGAACICVTMCGFVLPDLKIETFIFMVGYFFVMNLQVFVPSWLGTQLRFESQELMVAAYKSDWIPRSKSYRQSIKLFLERAKHPVVITGLKIFPLSLATYISVMKMAYSCFTLVRFIKDRQEH